MNKILINRRMSGIMILAIALAATIFSVGCNKSANTGNSTTSSSSSSTASSPTATLKAYYAAAMKKDVPTLKRYLSAGTLRVMEEGAKKMGKSLDEAFKEDTSTPQGAMPEFSNEKITGDTATVDMKAEGMTVTMPLVKEGGEWKLAMDKMLEDMKKAMGDIEQPAGNAPAGNANADEHGGHDDDK